jgi:hypothetical protein
MPNKPGFNLNRALADEKQRSKGFTARAIVNFGK